MAVAQEGEGCGDVYLYPHSREEGGMLIGFGSNTKKENLAQAFVEAMCIRLMEGIEGIAGEHVTEIVNDGLSEHPSQVLANFANKKVVRYHGSISVINASIKLSNKFNLTKVNLTPHKLFHPQMTQGERDQKLKRYQEVYERSQLDNLCVSPMIFSETGDSHEVSHKAPFEMDNRKRSGTFKL